MRKIEEWIDYLKKRRENLIEFLDKECQVNAQELNEKQIHTVFSKKLQAKSLKEMRMACIMDRFTLDSYKPECNLLELTPDNWKNEIEDFKPELLFIESAWQGKDGLWYRKIANGSPELYHMTNYCREKGIPVIFWNKEDPIYTDTFMPAARCADFVFTTDIDCIKKYKEALDHDFVYFLHFAAQPTIHNPIEKYERKDKFCFAGAYYHRYPKRARTFDDFSDVFLEMKGLDIYDRNYNAPRPEFEFPQKYSSHILGCLDSSEIDIAYKGYNYGINMNSVDQSQTMFARRVFEMLASNTVTVGNYSRGVKNLFGDLTICTNDAQTVKINLNKYCLNSIDYRKYRLLGLRKVLKENLYEDRLNYIVKKVFEVEIKQNLPMLSFFLFMDGEDIQKSVDMFMRQTYWNKRLYIIGDYKNVNSDRVFVLNKRECEKKIGEIVKEGYVGKWNPQNYYGENYLLDIALSFRYIKAYGVGKGNYYFFDGQNYVCENNTDSYRFVSVLKTDRSVFSNEIYEECSVSDWEQKKDIKSGQLFSIDEFNFCEGYREQNCPFVDDMVIYDQGIALGEIEKAAENVLRNVLSNDVGIISKEKIWKYCEKARIPDIFFSMNNENIKVESKLKEKAVQYFYFEELFEIKKYMKESSLNFQFLGKGDLELLGVCVFYDSNKNKISPAFAKLNVLFSGKVPENAHFFKMGFRISGSGICEVKEILVGLEHSREDLSQFLSRSNVLILSNQYPSYESLYRNMFVHKRVMAYKKEGLLCDVMRMNVYSKNEFSEFEGVNIIEGQAERLGNILETGRIDTVCVHFLDRSMWEILKLFGKKIRIFVWLHGADIHPWWRREFNYPTNRELEMAKKQSEERQAFWNEVFAQIEDYNIHFVFVSKYFADIVFEDYKIQLPSNRYSIIHNCIDTDMFTYVKKDPDQRKKMLSIRPFVSNKYANDLTVKCIEELSHESFWNDLQFRIIGNGDQFEKITAPLKKYSNVILEKRFLRQDEIAGLHKEYGIFLTPTREDTQGVSRDEAMSSGLVPVTNAVTAIPEFVDESCGILAPGEDYHEMVKGIEELYYNQELFEKMSENAAERVRKQTSQMYTINKEIELIGRK